MNPMFVKRLLAAGISACGGGGLILYSLQNSNSEKFKVNASWVWTTHTPQSHSSWDYNWDRRNPADIVPPSKGDEDDDRYKKQIAMATPTASRHIILVRHGQYNLQGKTDTERYLTPLGKEQAALTGKRLKELGLKYTHLTISTMQRAKETAAILQESLPPTVHVTYDPLLQEGAPIPPDPPVSDWAPPLNQFYEDGARIEAAFRKHIHRADPEQKEESYEVIVCHANVIRYFMCRVLQFPPEAWLRISLRHLSLTMITILPSGRVVLRSVGDSGHLPTKMLTTS